MRLLKLAQVPISAAVELQSATLPFSTPISVELLVAVYSVPVQEVPPPKMVVYLLLTTWYHRPVNWSMSTAETVSHVEPPRLKTLKAWVAAAPVEVDEVELLLLFPD